MAATHELGTEPIGPSTYCFRTRAVATVPRLARGGGTSSGSAGIQTWRRLAPWRPANDARRAPLPSGRRNSD